MMGLIVVNYNFLPKPFYYRLLLAQSKLPKTNFFLLYLGKITFKKKTLIPHVFVYYLVFQKDSENYSMEIDEFGDDTDVFVKVSEKKYFKTSLKL